MEITLNALSQLHIKGNIKSPEHFYTIQETTKELLSKGENMVHLLIEDSFSITSSVIHYFSQLIRHEAVTVRIDASDPRLYRTLENLELIGAFNVTLMQKGEW